MTDNTAPQPRKRGRPRIHPAEYYEPKPKTHGNKGKGTGPRPHLWRSGPDERRHEIYVSFLRSRAQANFRNEGWTLTYEEYFKLWDKNWENRGRDRFNVCMSRYDPEQPWDISNTYIRSRYDQLLEQAEKRRLWGERMRAKGFNCRGK